LSDSQPTANFGASYGKKKFWRPSVGGFAAVVLAQKARGSRSAFLALKKIPGCLSKTELDHFHGYLMSNARLRDVAKELRLETSPAKRARSTA
jgi:hypothetical protein